MYIDGIRDMNELGEFLDQEVTKRMAAQKSAANPPPGSEKPELPANWKDLSPAEKVLLGVKRSRPTRNPAIGAGT